MKTGTHLNPELNGAPKVLDRLPPEKAMTGTSDLKFEWVKTLEQINVLQDFAASFGHKIDCFKFPFVMFRWGPDREIIGYAQVVDVPTVFPAFHPGKTEPRAVLEVMKAFVGEAKLSRKNAQEGQVAVPLDTKTFVTDIMLRMGFVDTGKKLYAVSGD